MEGRVRVSRTKVPHIPTESLARGAHQRADQARRQRGEWALKGGGVVNGIWEVGWTVELKLNRKKINYWK